MPYRLLEEVSDLSAGDGGAGNMLIQGDNLEALKAPLPFYTGRVKCIYIDPTYNTRSAFEHYDDNLEHTQWLARMWSRLELLRDLSAEDGSIWVSVDDNEGHYLKVIMDEVFGRSRFIANNVLQKRYSRENRGSIGDAHELCDRLRRTFRTLQEDQESCSSQRTAGSEAGSEAEADWNEHVTLEIGPLSELSDTQRRVIALDYGMTDGKAKTPVRKALLHYALKRLGLDTGPAAWRVQDQRIVLLNVAELGARTATSAAASRREG